MKLYKTCTSEPCFFWLMMEPYHQIILCVLERIFCNHCKMTADEIKTVNDKIKVNKAPYSLDKTNFYIVIWETR